MKLLNIFPAFCLALSGVSCRHSPEIDFFAVPKGAVEVSPQDIGPAETAAEEIAIGLRLSEMRRIDPQRECTARRLKQTPAWSSPPGANEIVVRKIFRLNQSVTVRMEDRGGTWEYEFLLSEDNRPKLKVIRQLCFF